jgi:signal transduction histidine kinase
MKLDLNHLKCSLSPFSIYLSRDNDPVLANGDLVAAFNNLPVSILLFDVEGHILFYNNSFSRVCGLDDLEDKTQIEHVETLPFYLNDLKIMIQNHILHAPKNTFIPPLERQSITVEFPKGEIQREIGFSIRPEEGTSENQCSKLWVLIARDISRFKKLDAEEEQRQEEAQRRRKLATISKQIATYSTHIFKHFFAISQQAYLMNEKQTKLLQQQGANEDSFKLVQENQAHLAYIQSNIEEATGLFRQVERLNQPILLKLAPSNIATSLKYWVREFKQDGFLPEDVNFHIDIDLEVPKVNIDGFELKKVIKALLQNSLESQLASTPLDIKLYLGVESGQHADYVTINIEDNGRGIPQNAMDSIFDPFFTTKTNKLLGLGLPYAFKLTEAQKGKLVIESVAQYGTTAIIKLPTEVPVSSSS